VTNTLFKLVFIVAAILLSMNASNAEPAVITIKDTIADREFSLRLELPDGFKLVSKEGPDFYFYEIQKNSRAFVAVYVGSHPSFPLEHVEGSESTYLDVCIDDAEVREKLKDRPLEQFRILSEWKDGSLVHRELISRYSLGSGWPSYIHAVTTTHLSDDELQVADRILFTIQMQPEKRTGSGL
jgi:hypothetical protein